MSRRQQGALMLGLFAVTLTFVGCSTSSRGPEHSWEIHVKAVGEITRKSVEVHLVGVTEQEKTAFWDTALMTEYWQAGNNLQGNKLRNSAMSEHRVKVMRFGPGKDPNQVYTDASTDPNDPWNLWTAGADMERLYLMVLADLPGQLEDLPGDKDRRRLSLPLNPKRWKGHPKIIRIEVHGVGLLAVTEPGPEKAEKRFLVF